MRELDERLGLATLIAEHLSDSRQGLNTQFNLADLLRQSVYSRLAGYEDLNDAVRVSADPTFRLIGSPTLGDRGAALTSTLHWFETELLTREENLVGLMAVNREVLAQAEMPTRAGRIVLDMDSSESPVHGTQEGSAYNGHFESVCYHPLFLFNEHGDCVAAALRPGNVHSADDWDDLLVPEIDRQQAAGTRVAFRADAAFAKPEIARGERKPARSEPTVWFTSVESFAKVLSRHNRELLALITQKQPGSLTELAVLAGRSKSNLSRTLKTMSRYGLVELNEGQGGKLIPRVRYDHVCLDVSLTSTSRQAA